MFFAIHYFYECMRTVARQFPGQKVTTASSVYVVSAVELEEWNALAHQFSEATAFHFLPWLMGIAAAYHLKPVLLAARRGGKCVALWPFLEMRKAMLRIIGSPLPGWSTPYLGPLFRQDLSNGETHEVVRQFLRHPLLHHYAYFACKVMDHHRPIDLTPLGFTQVMRYDTYRRDLRCPEDELWNGLRRECRNHVRKAQKCGVTIQFQPDERFVDDYWSMAVETFAKAGIRPTHNRELVAQIVDHLVPAGHAVAASAFHGEERVAAALLLRDCRTMYYWGGASRLRHRHLSPHNLLQWQAMRLAKECGLECYDFISTTGGPGKFKQSFGPECVTISTHWERSPSRILLALKNRYKRYLEGRQRVNGGLFAADQADAPKPVTSPTCA